MHLAHNSHLAYCTNIHRGETWAETFLGLKEHTLRVKERVSPDEPYAIGLRLSHQASIELSEKDTLEDFKTWLEKNNCYVFTINGFPYGSFHGSRVKESVYQPDWATSERVTYTKRLFDLLIQLLPEGISGSVSTVPGSFKAFNSSADDIDMMFENLYEIYLYIDKLSDDTGHDLHLGLEPEPLCLFETTGETLKFFGLLVDKYPNQPGLLKRIGVNYDTCHLAIEYEEPHTALERLVGSGIRLSKIHLSSALKLTPTSELIPKLKAYYDEVYLHQTVVSFGDEEPLMRFLDLPDAVTWAESASNLGEEWRIHFHVPLHAEPKNYLHTTQDHILGTLDYLANQKPGLCQHFEMETYTWEVLPDNVRESDVVDQLEKEYQWTLGQLKAHNLAY